MRAREDRSDRELVTAARAADRDAFAMLVVRHRPMIVALVGRLVGSTAVAADAAQEAAVTALVALDRLRSPERFGAWYAAIALHIARRWLRSSVETWPLPAEWPDHRPGPDEEAEAADLARRVRQAVLGLAAGQRQAVWAFYWQGLTHAEAAEELGISPGAVKARLHQARATLAPRLAADAPPEDREVLLMPGTTETTWVDVEVTEVRRSAGDDPTRRLHAVVLQERSGYRRLPIYIGAPEAIALALSLEAVEMPRPMTYTLATSLIEAAAARVTEVRITTLAESTFYATVHLDGPAGPAQVDARPSDALNLALVSAAPIRIDAAIFDSPRATGHTAWEEFPTHAPELVAEVRDRQAEFLLALTASEREVAGPAET